MEEYVQHLIDEGGVPTKYIVGNLETDGHVHEVLIRDDLPRATTVASYPNEKWPHAHSIQSNGAGGMTCMYAAPNYHTHTLFLVVEAPSG